MVVNGLMVEPGGKLSLKAISGFTTARIRPDWGSIITIVPRASDNAAFAACCKRWSKSASVTAPVEPESGRRSELAARAHAATITLATAITHSAHRLSLGEGSVTTRVATSGNIKQPCQWRVPAFGWITTML